MRVKSIKKKWVFSSLVFILLIMAGISLACGQVYIQLDVVFAAVCRELGLSALSGPPVSAEQAAILWQIRLPRTLIGILVGAALAISGAVMQGVFSNPLADPGIIGVSSGAAFGAVVAIALGLTNMSMFYMPLFAVLGAAGTVALTFFLSMRRGKIPVMTLLLAGVTVSMFLGALTSGILTFISEYKLREFLFWSVGGLDYRRWEHVWLGIGPILFGTIFLCLLSRQLNILVLGDEEARAVGMKVMPMRLLLLFVASLTTAAAVCISGSIGFVGLVVPHIVRLMVGPEHRVLLPASALLGGIFLLACDTLGRVILPTAEIRVGIMTALLGAPYFLYLLRRIQRGDAF